MEAPTERTLYNSQKSAGDFLLHPMEIEPMTEERITKSVGWGFFENVERPFKENIHLVRVSLSLRFTDL
jgi:hypothetical protein